MDELFDQFLLMETINSPNLEVDSLFVHDTFFSNHDTTVAEQAKFQVTYGSNRLAQFTPELGKSKPVGKKKGELKSFEFPNIRHSQPFTAADTFMNDQLGKTVDPSVADLEALAEKHVSREMQSLKNMIWLRIEWICCQLLTGGAWTYTDDDITVTFDMGLPSDFIVTLGASDHWDETTADIDANVRLANRRIQRATGVGIGKATLGEAAADAFRSNQKVRDTLHNNNLMTGKMLNDPNNNYIGNYMNIDWYEYTREYEDENGDAQNFFPVNGVSFTAKNFNAQAGTLFGGVKELKPDKSGLTVYPVEIFTKTFTRDDPPEFSILVHSKPCPYYKQTGAALFMEVL